LCRATTSELNTILGSAPGLVSWTLFDLIDENTISLPYIERLHALTARVEEQKPPMCNVIPSEVVKNIEQLNIWEDYYLTLGYEGVILRDINGKYKNGRSTVREGGLLRIKRFADAEARVIAIEEAQENLNEKTINNLGYSERSSHQDRKIGNGMLGMLICEYNNEIIHVGPGEMTHEERRFYYNNPAQILNKIITFKHFPHGVKDKPRFPTFKNVRKNDI